MSNDEDAFASTKRGDNLVVPTGYDPIGRILEAF